MYQVIGMQQKKGEYQGQAYDNTLLYCTYPDVEVSGSGVEVIKVKTLIFSQYPVKLNDVIDVYYDKYGKVNRLQNVKSVAAS